MVARVLERPTLVLNRNWQPINVATVERALVMLCELCRRGPFSRNISPKPRGAFAAMGGHQAAYC